MNRQRQRNIIYARAGAMALLAAFCLLGVTAEGQGSPGNGFLAQGQAALEDRRPDEALKFLEEALKAFRKDGDRGGEATALKEMGTVLFLLGRYSEAVETQYKGLELARILGKQRLEARLLKDLGFSRKAQGEYPEASCLFEESTFLAQAVGDAETEVTALESLASLAAQSGDHTKSVNFLKQALAIAQRIDKPDLAATVQVSLAQIYAVLQDSAWEIVHYQHAIESLRQSGDRITEAHVLSNLGRAFVKEGVLSRGLAVLDEALRLALQLELTNVESAVLQTQLMALEQSPDPKREAVVAEKLLNLARRIDDPSLEARASERLANAQILIGMFDDPQLEEAVPDAGNFDNMLLEF